MDIERLHELIGKLMDPNDISEEALACRSYEQVINSSTYIRRIKPVSGSPYGIEHYRHYGGALKLELNRDSSY